MLCKKPYMQGVLAYGCGLCFPCRVSRRRLWTHRMMLESLVHAECGFVTLTYEDKYLPKGGTLVPKDLQGFVKRLRRRCQPLSLRYFGVGEYGEHTWRPHYHLALFGLGISGADVIQSAWGKGFTYTGDLTKDSATYVAGYVTKKLTCPDDEWNRAYRERKGLLLGSRYPEFARMSLRPGIGATALGPIMDVLTGDHGPDYMLQNKDVPMALQHGGKSQPLGRYLRKQLRKRYGFEDIRAPADALKRYADDQRVLLAELSRVPELRRKSAAGKLVKWNEQRFLQLEKKSAIHMKRGSL